MKVLYEENEVNSIEKTYQELRNRGRLALFSGEDPDRMYSLSFKVTKPALAEYLLISLLNNRLEDFELGINIVSINFDTFPNKEDVKRKLHEAIDTIID